MTSLFNIKGKVAVVTGGAGVLGGTIAKHLAEEGAKIVILDHRAEQVESRVEELKKVSSEVIGITGSVLVREDLDSAVATVLEKWSRVDILINAAGGNMPGATIAPDQTFFDLDMDDFKMVSDLNLNGTVLPTLVIGKVMADQKEGNIINISSMAAFASITRVVGYSASKAAVSNFTQWMAMEMAMKFGEKVRVNAIAPGFFIGDQNRRLLTNEDGSYTERGNQVITKTPMKRFGDAKELNGAIQFLCSEASSFVTGVVLPIDGGFNIYSGV